MTWGGLSACHVLPASQGVGMGGQKSAEGRAGLSTGLKARTRNMGWGRNFDGEGRRGSAGWDARDHAEDRGRNPREQGGGASSATARTERSDPRRTQIARRCGRTGSVRPPPTRSNQERQPPRQPFLLDFADGQSRNGLFWDGYVFWVGMGTIGVGIKLFSSVLDQEFLCILVVPFHESIPLIPAGHFLLEKVSLSGKVHVISFR